MSIVHAAHDATPETAAPGGVEVGFNYMRTRDWVAPSAPDYTANSTDAWPSDFTGSTSDVRAGWWNPGAGYRLPDFAAFYDEDNSRDNRLVGYLYDNGGMSYAWRVEVPPGTYRVWLGAGYFNYGSSQGIIVNDGLTAGNQTQRLSVPAMTFANLWHDIKADARKTEATWVSEYASKWEEVTVVDRGADATGLDFRFTYSNITFICHIRVQQQ